jgi:hypothetical protein
MSEKVLKYAGRRSMLLALIIMPTITIGLLFSGWLAPVPIKAQNGGSNPQSNEENPGCVATTNAWSGDAPTVITNGSVSPSTIYEPYGTAPTMPTIVVPVYSPTNIFTQLITYSSTNCGTATNTENITYSVSAVIWTNFSSPYTDFPSELTDYFTAEAWVIVTSSDTNICPSPGLIPVASATMASASVQAAATGFSLVTAWDPYGINHICVNTSPSKDPGVQRTDVGVGEKVNLSIGNLPANTSVQWDCGGVGSIDTPSQPACVWTAPDSTGSQDPNYNDLFNSSTAPTKACTVTATFSINGQVKTPSVSFTVYRPASINMKLVYPEHTVNTCTIGMWTDVYLAPSKVNFSAVSTREEAVDPYPGQQILIIGRGCYSGQQPHGTSVEVSMSTQVDANLGTKASVSPVDHSYFQTGAGGLGVGTGDAEGDIPNDWKCNSSAWNDNYCTSVEKATSSAVQGQSGVYQLDVNKCGADYPCKSSDLTVTKP